MLDPSASGFAAESQNSVSAVRIDADRCSEALYGFQWNYYFAVCALAMCLLYLPAFVFDFAVHNDYMIWSYDNHKCCLGFPETTHLLSVGRPIGAVLLNLHFATFTDIKSLAIGRGISLLTIMGAYYVFCLILIKNYKFSPLFSVAAGFLIFLLPSAILYVVWLTNFVPGSVTALLSVAAYYLISRPREKSRANSKSWRWYCLSPSFGYFVLFISFLVYPPVGIFCLIFPFICAAFMSSERWVGERREIVIQVAIVVCLLILYFVVTKFVLTPLLARYSEAVRDYVLPTSNYEFSFSTNPLDKLHLVNEFLAITFNLWTSNYFPRFYLFVLFFIIALGIWRLFGVRHAGGGVEAVKVALQRAAMIICLIGIGAAPIFIPKDGFVAYRIVFTAASMAVVLFLWGVHGLCSAFNNRRMLTFSIGAVVFLCWVFSAIRINVFVDNVHREFEFVRNAVRGLDRDNLTKVVVLAPEWGSQIVRGQLFYDFRYMGTNFARMDGIVRAPLRELGMQRRKARKVNVSFVPYSIAESSELMKYFCPCIDMRWAGFQSDIPTFSSGMGPMMPLLSEDSILKGNSVDELRSQSKAPQSIGFPRGPQMIIEGYLGYNIVLYNSRIFGFPQGLKPNYRDPNLGKTKGVLSGDSVRAVISAVEEIPKNENLGLRAPRLVAEGYKGYNIVAFNDKVFGFPQEFSPDYEDPDLAQRPGVLIGKTEQRVRVLIDRKALEK